MIPKVTLGFLLWVAAFVTAFPMWAQQPNDSHELIIPSGPGQQDDPLFLELRQASFIASRTVALDRAESLTLRLALNELSEVHGLVPRSPEAVVLPSQEGLTMTEVWLVELKQAVPVDSRLFLYYVSGEDSLYFLRVETRGDYTESARIWGSGSSELIMSHDGVAIVDKPSKESFRLQSPYTSQAEKASDTIACLGRQLGLTPNATNLGNRIAQSACGATNIVALGLTAFNCLSIPHPVATAGCIVGVTKLVSCGFANCSSPTSTATVEWTVADGCADGRGFSVRVFDRTRGGFYPPGGSYSIPIGGSRKFRFSAPRGSQLCIGAQTNPPNSSFWCVGFDGTQNPNYPGAGTSLCCGTIPSNGNLVKSNTLTCD